MDYRTSADLVAHEQTHMRAALSWALPAFGLGILGVSLGFLGHALGIRAVQLIGLAIGAAGVLVGLVTVVRAGNILVRGMLRRD